MACGLEGGSWSGWGGGQVAYGLEVGGQVAHGLVWVRWFRVWRYRKIILGNGRATVDEPWLDRGEPTVAKYDDRVRWHMVWRGLGGSSRSGEGAGQVSHGQECRSNGSWSGRQVT